MPKNTLPVVDPFHDPNLPSLAEALSKFESIPDETPSRKARVRAAVATIGRLLSKPPAEIPGGKRTNDAEPQQDRPVHRADHA